jgi:hypothetical protein
MLSLSRGLLITAALRCRSDTSSTPDAVERAFETLQRSGTMDRAKIQGESEPGIQQPATVSAAVAGALPVSC